MLFSDFPALEASKSPEPFPSEVGSGRGERTVVTSSWVCLSNHDICSGRRSEEEKVYGSQNSLHTKQMLRWSSVEIFLPTPEVFQDYKGRGNDRERKAVHTTKATDLHSWQIQRPGRTQMLLVVLHFLLLWGWGAPSSQVNHTPSLNLSYQHPTLAWLFPTFLILNYPSYFLPLGFCLSLTSVNLTFPLTPWLAE